MVRPILNIVQALDLVKEVKDLFHLGLVGFTINLIARVFLVVCALDLIQLSFQPVERILPCASLPHSTISVAFYITRSIVYMVEWVLLVVQASHLFQHALKLTSLAVLDVFPGGFDPTRSIFIILYITIEIIKLIKRIL